MTPRDLPYSIVPQKDRRQRFSHQEGVGYNSGCSLKQNTTGSIHNIKFDEENKQQQQARNKELDQSVKNQKEYYNNLINKVKNLKNTANSGNPYQTSTSSNQIPSYNTNNNNNNSNSTNTGSEVILKKSRHITSSQPTGKPPRSDAASRTNSIGNTDHTSNHRLSLS